MLFLFFFALLICIFIVFNFRIPAAGFYNKDDIPDFLVRYNTGIGFPVYFYSNVSWLASVKKNHYGNFLAFRYFEAIITSHCIVAFFADIHHWDLEG